MCFPPTSGKHSGCGCCLFHSNAAQDNYLSRDEMLAALQEVGLLNGIKARQLGE